MTPILSLRDVDKKYDGTLVLEKVSLDVGERDVLSVVGPNGAGKTTLLKIMAGIEAPTGGKVIYRGKPVGKENLDLVRRRCTMVFQRTVVFNTTVYKNVAYGLKVRGFPENVIRRKVNEALELVKLVGYEKRSAKKLSGGEQQRVALARALVLEPELLLLDEPTSNLDPKTTSIVEEAITYTNRYKGTAVVIATHNIFQARKICRRAVLLLNGKVVESGSVEEVFLRPSPLMAGFTGVENVFMGDSRPTEEGTSLIELGGGLTVEAAVSRSGRVTLFIRPEDIIVSKSPLKSSARNVLEGRIVEVSDLDSIVKLKVDVGRIFVVQVTKRSFREMNLNVGTRVFLAFKASSVRLL